MRQSCSRAALLDAAQGAGSWRKSLPEECKELLQAKAHEGRAPGTCRQITTRAQGCEGRMCASWSWSKADGPRWCAHSPDASPEQPDPVAPPLVPAPGLAGNDCDPSGSRTYHARGGPLEAGPVWRCPPRGSAARHGIKELVTCSLQGSALMHSAFSLRFLRDTAVSTEPSVPWHGLAD